MEEGALRARGAGDTGAPDNKGSNSAMQQRNRSTGILVIILENFSIEYPKLDKYGAKT